MPSRLRERLRLCPAGALEQSEVAQTEALIELLGACRH